MQTKTYQAGSIVYFAGDTSDRVYILKEGQAQSIFFSEETGYETREPINVGEFFGVKSILGAYPQEDTVQCVSECSVIIITYEEFENLVSKNKSIIIKMLRVFSNQLRRLNEKVGNLVEKKEDEEEANQLEGLYDIGEFYFNRQKYKNALYSYKKYYQYADENSSFYHTVENRIKECRERINAKDDMETETNQSSDHTKKYDTDDIIFLEFEKGDKFYMVQSGSVKITKVIKDVEKLLDIVYAGDFFGEMAILEDTTRSASAIANESSVLLELKKENFQSVLVNNTEMALKLSKMFAKRIFDSKRRLLILQLNETDLRIYDCLLLLAELQNIKREDYNEPQELKATVNDIANWCAVKPIEVQKVLRNKAGKIDIKANTILVKNLKEIQRQIDVKRKKSYNLDK